MANTDLYLRRSAIEALNGTSQPLPPEIEKADVFFLPEGRISLSGISKNCLGPFSASAETAVAVFVPGAIDDTGTKVKPVGQVHKCEYAVLWRQLQEAELERLQYIKGSGTIAVRSCFESLEVAAIFEEANQKEVLFRKTGIYIPYVDASH